MAENVGEEFQRETKYLRGQMPGGGLDWSNPPEPFKSYPGAETVALDIPKDPPKVILWETLSARRSRREFSDVPLSKLQLSQLLWAAQGVTARAGTHLFRTAPSAGALYPVETYAVVGRVRDVGPGVYHYDIRRHRLERIKSGHLREQLAAAALDQNFAAHAGVVFVWTAVFERTRWKYGQRAYRYVYLDAGHIAQNVALASVALGLGSCQIAALYDDEANALIDVDGVKESTLYMTAVGRLA